MGLSRLILAVAVGVTVASAQQAPAPLKLGDFTITGSIRTRVESWDWFGSGDNSIYPYSGTLVRVGVGQQCSTFDWQIELAAPILLGLPEDAVASGAAGQLGLGASYYVANNRSRNAGMVFAKQGFIRFKNLFGSDNHSLKLGRFEFLDGSEATPANATLAAVKRDRITQRLIGNFGWSDVGRSFDGFHYTYNRPKLNLTLVGAMPTRGVFQVDGWGQLDIAFLYASATGQIGSKKSSGEWRVLGIYYDDFRSVLKTDSRPLAVRRADMANIKIGTFGGHYLHAFETSAGTLDLMFWGVGQTGKWGRLDQSASAAAVEGGWQPPVLRRIKPWVRAGYFRGSGDGDPNDNRHQTFFQLLPTPRPFARFPFFDLVNNQDINGMLTVQAGKALALKCEVHSLRLANRNDMWYQGGGAFQPWTFGYTGRPSNGASGLATLYDLSADYNLNARTTISGYIAYAAGKSVIQSIYPGDHNGTFGYIELSHRF